MNFLVSLPRKAWRWLTSMRTALVLLFLLAIAAIPGALLPQRQLNEGNVEDYLAANGKWGEILDAMQMFDVFSSWWFIAILMLLLFSLVGCILPRSWDHYKAMKQPPVRAPKNLSRLPMHATGTVAATESELIDELKRDLKGWKVAVYEPGEDRAGKTSIAAEKGYLREFGNLVFHLGLVLLLVTIAWGRMVYYEGQVIVVAGEEQSQFCNTAVANFDSFRAGPTVDGTGLHEFCLNVNSFKADYLPNGQAEMFTSDVDYAEGDDIFKPVSEWKKYQLRVNNPLRISGDRVYLQGHGYAPQFTVTWPNGESRTEKIQFRPDDPTFFLSSGVLRFDPPAGMYPDLVDRRENQIAVQGLFAPTAEFTGEKGTLLQSSYPAMTNPAVAIDVYRGDAGLDTGRGQSIFSLDPSLMHSGQLQKIDRVNLFQGESVTLDDGTKVTFDGAAEFANFQVSHDPTQGWVLAASLVMLGGLVLSLAIKRRRVWVRLTPVAADGAPVAGATGAAGTGAAGAEATHTLVEMAGLARTDRAGWGPEFDRLKRKVLRLPDEDDVDEDAEVGAGADENRES